MTDKIDNEIVKAFECCINPKMGQRCPRYRKGIMCNTGCKNFLLQDVLDLVKRRGIEVEFLRASENLGKAEVNEIKANLELRKAEIERLERVVSIKEKNKQTIKSEAIKDFAERVKTYIDVGHLRPPMEICLSELDVVNMIDRLVEEMTEQRKEDEGK